MGGVPRPTKTTNSTECEYERVGQELEGDEGDDALPRLFPDDPEDQVRRYGGLYEDLMIHAQHEGGNEDAELEPLRPIESRSADRESRAWQESTRSLPLHMPRSLPLPPQGFQATPQEQEQERILSVAIGRSRDAMAMWSSATAAGAPPPMMSGPDAETAIGVRSSPYRLPDEEQVAFIVEEGASCYRPWCLAHFDRVPFWTVLSISSLVTVWVIYFSIKNGGQYEMTTLASLVGGASLVLFSLTKLYPALRLVGCAGGGASENSCERLRLRGLFRDIDALSSQYWIRIHAVEQTQDGHTYHFRIKPAQGYDQISQQENAAHQLWITWHHDQCQLEVLNAYPWHLRARVDKQRWNDFVEYLARIGNSAAPRRRIAYRTVNFLRHIFSTSLALSVAVFLVVTGILNKESPDETENLNEDEQSTNEYTLGIVMNTWFYVSCFFACAFRRCQPSASHAWATRSLESVKHAILDFRDAGGWGSDGSGFTFMGCSQKTVCDRSILDISWDSLQGDQAHANLPLNSPEDQHLPSEPLLITEPSAPVTEPSAPVTEPPAPITEPSAPITEPSAPITEPSAPMEISAV